MIEFNKQLCIFLILVVLFALPVSIPASEDTTQHAVNEEKFNPGEFIIDHILDAHEWHIATIGHTHISIPLPIIVYSYKQKQWHVFLSNKFHHGHQSYNGLALITEGELKGKIVEVDELGNIDIHAQLPLDLSITKNVLQIFIIIGLLLWVFLSVAKYYKENPSAPPRRLASWVEPLVLFIRDDIALPSIGHKAYKFMPYLLTVFFFIFFANLIGLIPVFPGGANVTGNIAVTMVLALFTFAMTTFSGNKSYWMHIVNAPGVPWWLKIPIPLMPIIELIGVFTKPFVLMVRLFANIAAGHIIALGFFSLIFIFGSMHWAGGYGISILSVSFAIFMTLLELLVAFIQAYVFTLLSAIYFGMAVEEHHHENTH
ncbi:MAG: F0F1 ATP synthase subunit A [Bacteroidales bacterium]|nr:F0F1 ATP synthase subunit A [Bacteroidales bacterium]